MNIQNGKKNYIPPQLDIVAIDNEISLALVSLPPSGPDEADVKHGNRCGVDPFKTINS